MLYSDMSQSQLEREMQDLRNKGQRAYDEENWSEYQVLMTKWYLAKSYTLKDTFKLQPGKIYRLAEEYDRLTAIRQEGVMVWGIKESTAEEVSIPLAMLAEGDD